MKKLTKTLTLLLAVLSLAAIMPLSVFADSFKYTEQQGTTTTFEKYLTMDEQANVPNATFKFTAAPGEAISATNEGMAVLAGIGTPTIGDVTFAVTDTTYDGLPTDGDTATAGRMYAKKTVTVTFGEDCKFPEPGIYRYIVTETATTNLGITNDTLATRTLDVYVTDDGNKNLVVSSYILHTGTDAPAVGDDQGSAGGTLGDKSAGYTNVYDTSDLTFSKTVAGNQASRDKYFEFTVKITGAVAGTKYSVDLTAADASIQANPNAATSCITAAVTQPNELTVTSDGTVTQKYYLQHGQSIKIKGIASGTEYEVTENAEDYKQSSADNTTGTISSDDVTAAFTNTRNGVIPTGVLLAIAPFALIMIVGAVGIIVMMGKKRRTEK